MLLFHFRLVTSALVVASVIATPTPRAAVPRYWFSFGDSYTTTGFNPSGVLPSVSNPIGNPAFPGSTNTGGPNWIGSGTATYNNSLIFTYNYAVGGAVIDPKLVPSSVLSMTQQVDQFLAGAGKKPAQTPWTADNALFSVWIGINDIGNSYNNAGDRGAFSDTLLNAEFALVDKLVNAGARNFLFINVPPVNRSPLLLGQSSDNQNKEKGVIVTHNQKYASKVQAYQSAHKDIKTWLWDSNRFFNTILDGPTAYGFKDATSYGQTGSFWGNNYHPASSAHVLFAKEIDSLMSGTGW